MHPAFKLQAPGGYATPAPQYKAHNSGSTTLDRKHVWSKTYLR